MPSLSILGLGSCRDAWIVVSSGQVVNSFQRVVGSEVKLSPVCCCLTDTPLQSNPFGFFTDCVLQVEHLLKKKKFVESKENSEMWSWLCLSTHKLSADRQTNALTRRYMNMKKYQTQHNYTHTQKKHVWCICTRQHEWHGQLHTWSLNLQTKKQGVTEEKKMHCWYM